MLRLGVSLTNFAFLFQKKKLNYYQHHLRFFTIRTGWRGQKTRPTAKRPTMLLLDPESKTKRSLAGIGKQANHRRPPPNSITCQTFSVYVFAGFTAST